MTDDDDRWEDYESGPFCPHWGDPYDCDECRSAVANSILSGHEVTYPLTDDEIDALRACLHAYREFRALDDEERKPDE